MSCCDPKVLTRNLELNDCLSCIVYDLPTKRLPKFLPKLQLADVKTMDVKKFDVIVRTAENLQGLIAADLAVDTGTGVATITDAVLAKKVVMTDIIMIDGYSFHVTGINEASGEITLEVVGDQSAPATIASGSSYDIYTNAQDLCSFTSKCTGVEDKTHEVLLQDISACYEECRRQNELAKRGAFKGQIDLTADNEWSMMVNHLEAMDKTLFFGVPSDKLSNGVFNYSAAGYKYFVEKYGVITTIPTGTALTADAVDQWACDMAERDVDADCVYMSPKTWKCLKKAFKNGCERCLINPAGNGTNAVGTPQYSNMLYLDGFSDPMEVIERSAIPDGEIYPVDSMNVDLITNTSEIDGRPRIMTQLESIVCSPKTKKHNYETTIGLKVYDPYRTGALKFDITAK